jgi:hypothetical protein
MDKNICSCGHERPEIIILDSNELSVSAWMEYWEQRGKLCWDCFCKKFKPQSQEATITEVTRRSRVSPIGVVTLPKGSAPDTQISGDFCLSDKKKGFWR